MATTMRRPLGSFCCQLVDMKGIAIADRTQVVTKCFDIDYILRCLSRRIRNPRTHTGSDIYWHSDLVQEGLQGIARSLQHLAHIGPVSVGESRQIP